MKIGEVARLLGVEVHVLRHWNDVGVVVPSRTSSGQRDYSREDLYRLRVLRACQGVGMTLTDIEQVLHRGEPDRATVIERHLQRIRDQQAHFKATEQFLVHVINCTHDLLTRCEECSTYAESTRKDDAGPSPSAAS